MKSIKCWLRLVVPTEVVLQPVSQFAQFCFCKETLWILQVPTTFLKGSLPKQKLGHWTFCNWAPRTIDLSTTRVHIKSQYYVGRVSSTGVLHFGKLCHTYFPKQAPFLLGSGVFLGCGKSHIIDEPWQDSVWYGVILLQQRHVVKYVHDDKERCAIQGAQGEVLWLQVVIMELEGGKSVEKEVSSELF